jgi:two-component system OmpR family response regulator
MSTVCIVDDDPDIREAMRLVLEMHGHAVIEASDGAEAIGCLHGAGADVILLDLMMPGMSGWEFLDERSGDPELASIPVVLLSGVGDLSLEAHNLEGVVCVQKPIELAVLLQQVDRLTHH